MTPRTAVLGLAAVMLVAGCSSGSSGGKTSVGTKITPVPKHPHTHTASPTPVPTTTTVTPTPTVTVTAPAGVPTCQSSQLSLSLGPASGAAGSTYTPIIFTNTGSKACSLRAYPGVSFVDTAGNQIGKPGTRDSGKITTVKLPSGGAANALLRMPEAGNFAPADCHQTTADRLRVYPPGEQTPLFVKDHADVCTTKTGRAGVAPVARGSG